ncbi:hypothetical protein FPOA_13305, partial [Fusarium poae]
QCPSSQVTGSLDWNALLPTGDEFRASLKAASAALFPHIKSFEELLTSINDEHCRLTAFERSLRPTKNEQATEQEKAQDALKDVEKSMATENKLPGTWKISTTNILEITNFARSWINEDERFANMKRYIPRSKSNLTRVLLGFSKPIARLRWLPRDWQLEAEKAEVMKEKWGLIRRRND